MRILLIEDDHVLGSALRDHVGAQGHAVDWAKRLDDAEAARRAVDYELVLLDLNLPDGRGLDLLKTMRRDGDATPVIILTAMEQLTIRLEGLNAGADDYLVKPFDLAELSARLNAVARRTLGRANSVTALGPLSIDIGARRVARDGKRIDLTGREWAVLERLMTHPGAVVSKAQLEDALFAFGEEVESNAMEVYVSRLRRKIGAELIHTVRGMGYRLEA